MKDHVPKFALVTSASYSATPSLFEQRSYQLLVFPTTPHNQEPQRGIGPRAALSLSVIEAC